MASLPPVLLAEDDDVDVLLLTRAFQSAGIVNPLLVARDGQEAIDLLGAQLRGNEPLPVMAILDIRMPRRDGFQVLTWIRSQAGARCLPVLLHSTSDHPAESERAYALGANGYMVKPSATADRIEMVRFLKGWLTFVRPSVATIENPLASQALLHGL